MAKALQFDGVNDYAITGNSLSFASGVGTMEVFFKCVTIPVSSTLSIVEHRISESFGTISSKDGKFYHTEDNNVFSPITTANTTDYFYTAVTSDGTYLYTYWKTTGNINRGETYGATASIGSTVSDPFEFGGDGANSRYWSNIIIAEVRIWSTYRTEAQIQASAQRGAVSAQTGLWGLWKFDEGSGSTLNDSSGNGNHATIYGATWVDTWPAATPLRLAQVF